jgi:hypothetical protein
LIGFALNILGSRKIFSHQKFSARSLLSFRLLIFFPPQICQSFVCQPPQCKIKATFAQIKQHSRQCAQSLYLEVNRRFPRGSVEITIARLHQTRPNLVGGQRNFFM